MLVLIAGLLGIFTFGFFVADILLGRKAHILERIAVGFLLGSGIFTFVLFLANWKLNIPFGLKESLLILLSLNLIAFLLDIFFTRKVKVKSLFDYNFNFKEGFENLNLLEKIIIGLILFLFFSSLIHNIYWPVLDWDALALYDFRAKVFLVDKSLVHAALNNDYFIHYPLYTSLLHLFVYQTGVANPLFIYSFLYLCFIVVFYFSLRKYVSRFRSMIFALILAFTPEFFGHSMMAYTNLPYSIFISLGVFYLYRWIRENNFCLLILSAFLVGFSSWVRITEPFWIAPVLVFILFSIKKKKWKEFIVFPLIVYSTYYIWRSFMNFIFSRLNINSLIPVSNYFSILTNFNLDRWLEVLDYLYKSVFSTWGALFFAFLISIAFAFYRRKKSENRIFLFFILVFFVFLIIGTYLFSFTDSSWRAIPDSARRMSMFFIVLIVYYLGIAI
jgi:hypothetical protein